MPSPFPGMNPYLENPVVRLDFHLSIIYAIRVQLARKLRPLTSSGPRRTSTFTSCPMETADLPGDRMWPSLRIDKLIETALR